MQKKIAIIGGGPAGIAAAIQLRRYMLDPVLFESGEIGGLLNNAWNVENYPGFPEGISGTALVELFKKHLEKFDVDVRKDNVEMAEYYDSVKRFEIRTSEASFSPEYMVVASGTKPRKLEEVENLPDECKRKIFYEVYPLLSVENKKIAVIGAGDAAFDYALNLARKNEVVVLNRSKRISALPQLQDKLKKSDKITYCENAEIFRIESLSDGSLAITIGKFEEQWLMEVDFLVAAVGREPRKDFYSKNLRKKEKALIDKGILYVIGDASSDRYRQASIGVGEGIRAAMQIYDRIREVDR